MTPTDDVALTRTPVRNSSTVTPFRLATRRRSLSESTTPGSSQVFHSGSRSTGRSGCLFCIGDKCGKRLDESLRICEHVLVQCLLIGIDQLRTNISGQLREVVIAILLEERQNILAENLGEILGFADSLSIFH